MTKQNIDFKELFSSMPFPVFLLERQDTGDFAVVRLNHLALSLTKVGENQAKGAALKDVIGESLAAALEGALERCVDKQKQVTVKIHNKTDTSIQLGSATVSPFGDNLVQVIGIPVDKESADLLQERDDAISLLTSVFDVSEVGIVVTDKEQRIVRVNDSFVRIYGWSRDELIGREYVELITPDEREMAARNHEEFMRSGIRSSGEVKIIRKDGNIANALFTTAALELSMGRSFQVTTIMDITLRKQMELSLRLAKEQADAANQAKSTFLANMSHELRTPLNAIIGFSEMMMKETFGELGNPKYKEYLADIHLSARHLLEIINEVLDMSKIEAGRVELDEEYIDVEDLISAVSRMMASRAFSSGLKLTEVVEEDMPPLFADPRLVRQILINLVGNAVKYSNTNGEIKIMAERTEMGNLQLIVEDNGVGIPKERIREALEPFGQVSIPDNVNPIQGTGLGLPLAKAMAELHQGYLSLESDVGRGTKVTVEFPASRLREKERTKGSPFAKFGDVKKKAGLAQEAD